MHIPPLTQNALNYTWRQLAQRAGTSCSQSVVTGFEELGIPIFYGVPKQAQFSTPGLIIRRCTENAWSELLSAPENSLDWVLISTILPDGVKLPFGDLIPVIFWGDGCKQENSPFVELGSDGSIIFNADILAATFLMLSRWEEIVRPERDAHQRFPAAASVAYKQNFIDRPIVDEYALILRAWLKRLLPDWQPRQRKFHVKLTHDIDHLRYFSNWKLALRSFQETILERSSLEQIREAILEIFFPLHDPYLKGVYTLAALSRRYGYKDTAFYFMADQSGDFGSHYDLSSGVVRKCIQNLQDQNFEIGFHSGYNTFNDSSKLKEEKERMDTVLGIIQYGGRQHYLRFQAPNTWRNWERAGLTYDSTLGYAESGGFRCGTCHPFAPFDLEEDRELNILEYPLIVMDATLKGYCNFSPEQALEHILLLAKRCQTVEGVFTFLWHNTSLFGKWKPWAKIYEKVLIVLAEIQNLEGIE